jgi:nucleotide-binding universal stress UspA family protein
MSDAQQRERIVVGVDGSEAADAALRWAAGEAARRAACLEAVIAWRPSPAIAPPAGHPGASTRNQHERREDAEAVLDGALTGIDTTSVELERRAMRGSPHRVLLEAAEGASLLVIGGHAGKLAGKLPWSTGQQLVHEADCPVVVVPPGAVERIGQSAAELPRVEASPGAGVAGGGVLPG